jgi:plasmid stability protein
LTLDDDIANALKTEARRSGKPFKAVVNDLLRAALYLRRKHRAIPPFKVHGRSLGVRPGLDYDRISDLVEQLEGPLQR